MSLTGTKPYAHSISFRSRWSSALIKLAAVGDQIIVSVTNFILTLVIGRIFSAEEFASYGIGLSIGLMLQGLQRHTVTIPLMLEPEQRARRRARAIGAEQLILLGCTILAAGLTLAILLTRNASNFGHLVVIASGVCLIVYLQLEFTRAFLIKLGRPFFLIAGASWYAVVVIALSLLAITHRIDYLTMLACLTAAMLIHAVVVLAVAGLPDLRRGLRLLTADIRRYGIWSAIATATYTGYNHVPLLILGAIAAPVHAAAFTATRSLLQPLQILLRGFDAADKSAFARAAHDPFSRKALNFTLKLTALYAAIGVIFGAVVFLIADRLIVFAYGAKFADHSAALVAWVPAYVLLSITMPLESLVYARKAFHGYFLIRGIASVIAIAASIPLINAYSDIGAISACALGWGIAAIGSLLFLIRGTRT